MEFHDRSSASFNCRVFRHCRCAPCRSFAKQHQLFDICSGCRPQHRWSILQNNVLLIDLSRLRLVHVDPDEKVAMVFSGDAFSIRSRSPIIWIGASHWHDSATGIAGLTLGGGFGWLSRTLGMTVDNLISIEAVTVEGERLVAIAITSDLLGHGRWRWNLCHCYLLQIQASSCGPRTHVRACRI